MITTPSGGQTLLDKGYYNVSGLAWSGRGRIRRVDASFDGGAQLAHGAARAAGALEGAYPLQRRLGVGRRARDPAESRDRPDAQAIDWNQWRVSARVSLTLRSDADRWLPPARPAAGTP